MPHILTSFLASTHTYTPHTHMYLTRLGKYFIQRIRFLLHFTGPIKFVVDV